MVRRSRPSPSAKRRRDRRKSVRPAGRRSGAHRKKAEGPLSPEEAIRRRRRRLSDRRDLGCFAIKLVVLLALLAVLFGCAFGITPMENNDMSPRISAGDLLLYYRLGDGWSAGDVLVFEKDGEQYVGRIVAVGGDTVEVTEQATLVVNGSTVVESDIYETTPRYEGDVTYPVTLEEDELFLLCDHREGGTDSRYFGPVRKSEVKGKVITAIRRSGL